MVIEYDRASTERIQQMLQIGYARAARIMEQLEAAGIVGPVEGGKPREVLIHTLEEAEPFLKKPEEQSYDAAASLIYSPPDPDILSKDSNPAWEPQLATAISSDGFREYDFCDFVLGINGEGELVVKPIEEIGNLLVVGNPQSKKEVFIDTLITKILFSALPSHVRLILVDTSRYLNIFNSVPHLLTPVVNDWDKTVSCYRWALLEIDRRTKIMEKVGVRNINSYKLVKDVENFPRIIIVSMYEDLTVETGYALQKLVQFGSAAGIHVVFVANRGGDIDASIKANVPNRLVFSVTSRQESLSAGVKGAEQLKAGEALYRDQNNQEGIKIQTIFTSEVNIKEATKAVISSV